MCERENGRSDQENKVKNVGQCTMHWMVRGTRDLGVQYLSGELEEGMKVPHKLITNQQKRCILISLQFSDAAAEEKHAKLCTCDVILEKSRTGLRETT